MIAASFPALLQAFFTDRLLQQRQASPHTVAGYRDSFRLFLHFAEERLGKAPSDLAVEDIAAPFVGEFLGHLETDRGNSARTRNVRLAAIHSFFRYVASNEPALALVCQRVLAVPSKRYERGAIEFLNPPEIDAFIAAPDPSNRTGRRDRAILLVMVQTGLRVSELIGLDCQDIVLGSGAHVKCVGKGRKQRCTPLRRDAVTLVEAWLRERRGAPDAPAFPSIRGGALSRDSVEHLVSKHAATAQRNCPSLMHKNVTPHVLRHTAAMELLRAGVDRSVIALWLGHESMETTQMYLHADVHMKERALARTNPLGVEPGRFRPDDALLAFLEGL
ncbi:MAG: site-specific integrase [Chloroflexi bacterium]|nr:site-specific integrase [Chloroflexota bacterium]